MSPWWHSAVVYQIYPRSFCDTDGDGIGDLEGIRRRLDHLAWLGVDAIWLSPVFPSPMKDFGYDVADYCDVDPLFGALADLDRLIEEVHARGMRLLLDWVPNHTSDRHPWFVESRSSRTNAKHDWYVWRDGDPDTPPNNWAAAFPGGPAWSWDTTREQWYLHLFTPEQPDLDWTNPAVVEAMHDTLRFWLDRGVDGFRMDVIHCIGKDPALPDVAPELAAVPVAALNDDPRTHELLRAIRRVVDGYPNGRLMIGEVFLLDTHQVATYYGAGDELHLSFNFPPLFAPWDADAWREQISTIEDALGPRGGWPTWVLSNHDNPRHRTRYGSEAHARAAAVLLLTLRGTAFLYAGEELGIEDAAVPHARRLDPGKRDGCRAPIPWEAAPPHGWASDDPWLPWPPDPTARNAETLRAAPNSILRLYRRLLTKRRASPALHRGSIALLPSAAGTLAYRRETADDRRCVVVNFTDAATEVTMDDRWKVAISSAGAGEGAAFTGRLQPLEAVLLEPAELDDHGPARGIEFA